MMPSLDHTGTRAYKAQRIRHRVLGIPGFIIYLCALIPFGWMYIQTNDPIPCILASSVLVFVLHAVWRFVIEELEEGIDALPSGTPLAHHLSPSLIALLRHKKTISAGDLFDAAIRTSRGAFLLEEMAIDPKRLLAQCRDEVERTIDLPKFIEYGVQHLASTGETRIDAPLVLALLFKHVPCCTSLLHELDLSEDDLPNLLSWEASHRAFRKEMDSWDPHKLAENMAIGRSWVLGYTDALDQLTSDISVTPARGEKTFVVHKDLIESVQRILSRSTQRNILLLGKSGVGKRTLIENVARALHAHELEMHIPSTRVLLLRTEVLLSGVSNPDAFLLKAISKAKESGHFILVVRDLATFLKATNANLRTVLMGCLESKQVSVVGIADVQEYHTTIKGDSTLDALFEKLAVEDTSDDETMRVLMMHYFALERKHVRITYKATKTILELCKRYISGKIGMPGGAVLVMDDAVARARERGEKYVTDEHVREVVSLRGKVNVQKVTEGERERLLNLEDTLKSQIIGQDAAVRAVVNSLKRARIDLSDRKRPIGTFLFLGPTGVGKTQTAKVLANQYFGSVDAVIRMDMNEFSHPDSLLGIIGSASGQGPSEGFLSQRVQDKPYSLILLDEIEKAHPTVLNHFLQILDEGFLTDARGVRTDFRNTIIIATSNAGALFIRDFVKQNQDFKKDEFKKQLVDSILQQKLFSPEFLNRFDDVVLFYPLSKEDALQVGSLMLQDIVGDIQRKRGITVRVDQELLAALIERGYSIEFGAREMRRTMTDMVESYLADYLLRNDVKRGSEIVIRKEDLKW